MLTAIHLDITANYENQKHHEKKYGTLTATYLLNGEYFIIHFIFCVLKGEETWILQMQ